MRVIIAGGTGFVGRFLANDLTASGHEVIVLSRNPAHAQGLASAVRVERWDAETAQGWGHLADGAQAIINLAGANIAGDGFFPQRWTDERKQLIISSRVNSGKAIVAAIEQAQQRPAVLVQASAVGYYGTHPFSVTLAEGSPAGDDWLASVCQQWEAATDAVEALGVRRAIIRLGAVLSFQAGALQRLAMPFRFYVGGPMGSGGQPFSWVHPADIIGAVRFLLETPSAAGAFNLTTPQPDTSASFARALGIVMQRPSWLPVPAFALRLMFGEVATVVVDGQKVLPSRLQSAGYGFKFEDANTALRDLYNSNL